VSKRFNGHELFVTLRRLVDNDIGFYIATDDNLHLEDEITKRPFKAHDTIENIHDTSPFQGLFVISGNLKDTIRHWHDNHIRNLVEEFATSDKVIAAICCSVPTIRYACKERRVSVFPLVEAKRLLTDAGAILTGTSRTVDGKIVTAETQMSTGYWVEDAIALMQGQTVIVDLPKTFTPQGTLRNDRLRRYIRIRNEVLRERSRSPKDS